jgi:hypothetical protein
MNVLLLISIATLPAVLADMTRVLLPDVKCLDGSPAGFYVDRTFSTKWVMWLQGGGVCSSAEHCEQRSKSLIGSSKNWAKDYTPKEEILQQDTNVNPDFANFNHIYVPYCSGDVWTGKHISATNPFNVSNSDWTGYFQGHLIIDKILEMISQQQQVVTDFILTGCSAGGLGTFINCDHVSDYFPAAKTACHPESGYFGVPFKSYEEYTNNAVVVGGDLHSSEGMEWLNNIDSYMIDMPAYQDCVTNAVFEDTDDCTNEKCCFLPPYLYPYIKSPMFISENTVDSYQVFTQKGCPEENTESVKNYVLYAREQMVQNMYTTVVIGPKVHQDGLFAPACLKHCVRWTGNSYATVRGKTLQQALGDWYLERDGGASMYISNNSSPHQLLSCK